MPKARQVSRKGKLVEAAAHAPELPLALTDAELYINRELSLLAFQRRVLQEAQDDRNPLLERIKFLSIIGSNLDEFFMVRTAGLLAQVEAGIVEVGPDRLSPQTQLASIRREVKKLFADVYKCLHDELEPAIRAEGIRMVEHAELTPRQTSVVAAFFKHTVFPVLTPLAFDPGRPFPHISNQSLNLAVVIRDSKGAEHFARLKVPDSLPQLVPLTARTVSTRRRRRPPKHIELVWLEQVIAANLDALFPGMEVTEAHPFHVTRDADIGIRELEAEDLLESIEEGLRNRRFGDVVRLMVSEKMPAHVLKILMTNLEIDKTEVYRVREPLALNRLSAVYNIDRPDLKYNSFVPAIPAELITHADGDDSFSAIRRQDVLLHHPYDSFQPVVDFLRKAAQDDNVLAIKMVLYRVGRNSPVVEALLEAMENGKQVTVLVELKARFDEESNIEWARKLEEQGVHVVYGLLGLKIHCKVALVVRREQDIIRRYVHLGTGNYNAVTSHFYTDIGMFTCDERVAEDVTDLFNFLTGYSDKTDYNTLLVAPVNLRARFGSLIEREIQHAAAGRPAELIFKMNSLSDPEIIKMFYRASQQNVKIRLIVRGICCLRPGIPGVSENIEVTSILGRFLEHSRIYYFGNDGSPEIYLGSADLMSRNLNRRVELLFPVQDHGLSRRIRTEILAAYLTDNQKARKMNSDGSYTYEKGKGKKQVNSQETLLPSSA